MGKLGFRIWVLRVEENQHGGFLLPSMLKSCVKMHAHMIFVDDQNNLQSTWMPHHTSKTSLCVCFLKRKWPTSVMSGNCVCVSPQWKTHRENCIQWNLQPQPFARWQWIFSSNRRRSTWYLSSMISNSEKKKKKNHKNLELRSSWCLSSMMQRKQNTKTKKTLSTFFSAVV
jgi:hypothetical protein